MATFSFELVSPERLLFSGEVNSVVVPGTEGTLTVLAQHEPFMTSIRPGIITITQARTGIMNSILSVAASVMSHRMA